MFCEKMVNRTVGYQTCKLGFCALALTHNTTVFQNAHFVHHVLFAEVAFLLTGCSTTRIGELGKGNMCWDEFGYNLILSNPSKVMRSVLSFLTVFTCYTLNISQYGRGRNRDRVVHEYEYMLDRYISIQRGDADVPDMSSCSQKQKW